MSTGKLGMNPEEVDRLAKMFEDAASQIQDAVGRVTQQLSVTTWEGSDRMNFETSWQSDSARQLSQIDQLLKGAAGQARRNAQDQRTTSGNL